MDEPLSPVNISIYVFKEGLLSWFGHNLRLRVTPKSVSILGGTDSSPAVESIRATVDPNDIEVVSAIKGVTAATDRDWGALQEDPAALRDKDRVDILQNLREKVLKVKENPEISFVSTRVEPSTVYGTLFLNGRSMDVYCSRSFERQQGSSTMAEVVRCPIDQRRWGIQPFAAVGGGLKIQPVVVVEARRELPSSEGMSESSNDP
jgi:hypothetical protein